MYLTQLASRIPDIWRFLIKNSKSAGVLYSRWITTISFIKDSCFMARLQIILPQTYPALIIHNSFWHWLTVSIWLTGCNIWLFSITVHSPGGSGCGRVPCTTRSWRSWWRRLELLSAAWRGGIMIYLSGIFKKLHTILYYIISYIIRYNLGVRPLKSPLTPCAATSSLAMARLPW